VHSELDALRTQARGLRSADVRCCWVMGLLVVALAAASVGCSAVVDPEVLLIRCETQSGTVDPCAERGLTCSGGTCQPCAPEAELCDGRDNDCDGHIDEGHDADNDGFTWCGGGRTELVDCVPDDGAIHPTEDGRDGAEERCDGRDNDCDSEVDEDPRCEPTRSCVEGSCSEGLVCDRDQDRCVVPRTRGSSCQSDAECSDGFCVSTAAVGLDDVLADSLCATACCKDANCPEGSVCVQSGSGARVCLPAEIAGRQSGQEGERCTTSGQCASGVCQDRRCVATCSSDEDCGTETCRLNVATSTLLEGAGAWICGEPGGRDMPGSLCTSFDPAACQSALCLSSRCVAPCGADADCAEGYACRYTVVRGLLGGGRVTACVSASATESVNGATCCTSDDCGEGEMCKPMRAGDAWGMYCQAQPVD
jgi:hypothetical protein